MVQFSKKILNANISAPARHNLSKILLRARHEHQLFKIWTRSKNRTVLQGCQLFEKHQFGRFWGMISNFYPIFGYFWPNSRHFYPIFKNTEFWKVGILTNFRYTDHASSPAQCKDLAIVWYITTLSCNFV